MHFYLCEKIMFPPELEEEDEKGWETVPMTLTKSKGYLPGSVLSTVVLSTRILSTYVSSSLLNFSSQNLLLVKFEYDKQTISAWTQNNDWVF